MFRNKTFFSKFKQLRNFLLNLNNVEIFLLHEEMFLRNSLNRVENQKYEVTMTAIKIQCIRVDLENEINRKIFYEFNLST